MVLRKLAISHLRTHRVRTALTVAAVALSVGLVVAVTSGYASLESAARLFLDRYLGSTDAMLVRQNDPRGLIPSTLTDELRDDREVHLVLKRLDVETAMLDQQDRIIPGRQVHLIGIERPLDTRVEQLEQVAGGWFDTDHGHLAVVDQVLADSLELEVGDTISIPGESGVLRLQIVGVIYKPAFLAQLTPTVYAPMKTVQQFMLPESSRHVNRVMIEFNRNVDADAFVARWTPRLAEVDPALRLKLTHENRRDLDQNLQGLQALSYMGGTISMLAATFIVFSALSMGVSERARMLAMLRAIGMHRRQVGSLVVIEGLALALVGAAIGVPLGFAGVQLLLLVPDFRELLGTGAVLSWGGVTFGVVGSVMAAVAASFLPAWSAMRVSPLEAMAPLAEPPRSRVPWKLVFVGLLLASIDLVFMYGPIDKLVAAMGVANADQIARAVRFYGHFALGVPGVMIGFFLLAPLFVWLMEKFAGRAVASALGVRFSILRQQLSSGIWRAAGTCAALMVGLAILVVMQVQGHTMINGWRLPDRFPDIFIVRPLGGFTENQVRDIETIPGIRPDEVMPIAIASPELGGGFFAIAGAALLPDATMFFGIDPDKAFDLMDLDFREGNVEQAREMLKKGRHVIVTEEYKRLKGLGVGDTLALRTARHGMLDYTIAGVVWSPGIDVLVSGFDLGRQIDQRTAASVFGTLDDAREDFGVERIYLFVANLEQNVDRGELLKLVQERLGVMGMHAGDARQIKEEIRGTFFTLLTLASTVAFAAMAVASLGVTNTIMASIRSRRWQFGVLRSIGVTRGHMLRLVLAEAVLIGLAGCALGLSAGALMSVNARGLGAHTLGYVPPLSIPWEMVGVGLAAVMFISIAASLWPAALVARTEPLRLLQAGRSAS